MKPYIGITGFMAAREVLSVLRYFHQESYSRKLMVGILVSSKTIMGIPNRLDNRYPKPENMGSIFQSDKRCLNLIHFNTKETELKVVYEHLYRSRDLAGSYCHGFQLNMAWPDVRI